MSEQVDEPRFLTLYGMQMLAADGATAGPLTLRAEQVDALIDSGAWGPGRLDGIDTSPRPHDWPPRWRHLRTEAP